MLGLIAFYLILIGTGVKKLLQSDERNGFATGYVVAGEKSPKALQAVAKTKYAAHASGRQQKWNRIPDARSSLLTNAAVCSILPRVLLFTGIVH